MPTPAGHYDYAQLEGLWIGGGGPPRLAPLMAAIAMAESGGNARARNPSGASGLWQILGNPFPGDPFNPQVNARMAVAKWKSQGLGAWVTYTSGAYKRFFRKGVPPAGGGGVTAPVGIPYRNPLRSVRHLQPERVDMGVDYAGSGPVYALGPGTITAAGHAWSGAVGAPVPGTWITERLSAGPLKGRQVYVAEDIFGIQVRPGQRVTAGTVLGQLRGGLETGLAAPGTAGQRGETLAAQLGEQSSSGDPGANPTLAGAAYSRVLAATGAPGGIIPKGVQPVAGSGIGGGGAPSWLKDLWHSVSLAGGAAGGAASGLSGIAGAISGIGDTLSGIATAVDWLLHPENWVRIIAGMGGGVMVISGVVVLAHVGGQVPVPGTSGSVSARPAALPVGVLLVGGGAVLLFVAFHNLPGDPANIGELLGSLRDEAQAASAGQKAAA